MNLNRHTTVTLAVLSLCGCSQQTDEPKRPNIVFIMTDDHALSAISAYNGFLAAVAPTPSIDRIGREGVRFDNFFVTNSISGPSRACIVTGKYSHINGFYKNEDGGDFDPNQTTFPMLLQDAGYQTAMIGKWHLGSSPVGFDYYKVLFNKEGQGSYFDPVFELSGGELVTETGRYSTDVIKEDALEWLDKRDRSKPFMMMYQFKAPHRPCDPSEEYQDYLKDVELPYPDTYNDDYAGRPAAAQAWNKIDGNTTRKDMKLPTPENLTAEQAEAWEQYGNNKGEDWTPDESMSDQQRKDWKYQTYVKDYLRCVKHVDDAIGQVLDYLDAEGIADNTIVIYTSDQGFFLGEHGGWFDKRFMYEETLHMPCLIRYPDGIKAGQVNSDLMLNIDYAPTLLDYAGVEIPDDIQGKSFRPVVEGKQKGAFRDGIYYHYYEYPFWHNVQPHYGVRTDRYKLIHYYYDMDEWELFDLQEDPFELNNLYDDPSQAQKVEELKAQLDALKEEVKMDKSYEELRAMTNAVIPRLYVKEAAN
ncbi:MAG: sulfatase [Rikenellaceae bacterium]